jgi:pimeloyl-ACP methyl ester carboxylesterase
MVLVEAADDPDVLWSLMPEAAVASRRAELAKSPEGLDLDTFVAGAAEMHALSKSIGATPLVVLSRGQPDAPKGAAPDVAAAWLDRWNAQQAELPALSTNVVRVVAPSSGHMLPAQAPSLVIAAVEEVLRAARTGARVEEACLLPFANEWRVS